MRIFIRPRNVLRILMALVLALYVLGVAILLIENLTSHGRLLGVQDLLNPGLEANIPTWFSSSMLLLCSALLAVIGAADSATDRRRSLQWRILSVMFLYMSVDEAAHLHESIDTALCYVFPSQVHRHYGWVIPGVFLAAVVTLGFVRFVASLPRDTKRLFIASGALYITGASVMEAIGRGWEVRHGVHNVPYTLMVTAEETLEMTGAVVFLYALMAYIGRHMPNVSLDFDCSDSETSDSTVDTGSSKRDTNSRAA